MGSISHEPATPDPPFVCQVCRRLSPAARFWCENDGVRCDDCYRENRKEYEECRAFSADGFA